MHTLALINRNGGSVSSYYSERYVCHDKNYLTNNKFFQKNREAGLSVFMKFFEKLKGFFKSFLNYLINTSMRS